MSRMKNETVAVTILKPTFPTSSPWLCLPCQPACCVDRQCDHSTGASREALYWYLFPMWLSYLLKFPHCWFIPLGCQLSYLPLKYQYPWMEQHNQAWILLKVVPEARIWGPAVYFGDCFWSIAVDVWKTQGWWGNQERVSYWIGDCYGQLRLQHFWEFWEEMANICQSWSIRMAIKLGKLSLTPGIIGWQLVPGSHGHLLFWSVNLGPGTKAENNSVCRGPFWVCPRQLVSGQPDSSCVSKSLKALPISPCQLSMN